MACEMLAQRLSALMNALQSAWRGTYYGRKLDSTQVVVFAITRSSIYTPFYTLPKNQGIVVRKSAPESLAISKRMDAKWHT